MMSAKMPSKLVFLSRGGGGLAQLSLGHFVQRAQGSLQRTGPLLSLAGARV